MLTDKQNEERFNRYMDLVLKIEGGYVNDPDDPGGETNYGITKAVARSHGYNGSMKEMPKSKAIEIYKKSYWDGKIMPNINNDLSLYLLCHSIHSGYVQAIKTLQKSLKVKSDGIAGVDTLNALSVKSEHEAMDDYNWAIMGFYIDISPKTKYKYVKGWYNRLSEIREFAK